MSLPEVDTFIFFLINRDLQNRLFDTIMPFITSRAYLLLLPFFAWLFLKERKQTVIILGLGLASLALSDWGSNLLKYVFERTRPCAALEGVHLLVGCSGSYSMPSNHATNAFAFVSPFYFLLKDKIRYIFVVIALLVAFSRVYIGVHYPSDILVGALFGIVTATSIVGLYNWSSGRFKENPYTTILLIFLLAVSLFRIYYITAGPLDLSPDEAHYWEWSRRIDWSYYSKGPLIAYLIYVSTSLFGDTVFGIRIMAVICSALSSIIFYILGKNLYDERVGFFSALLLQIIPLFSTYGVIFTIDSPFIFFWMLSLLLFWKALNSQKSEAYNELTKEHRISSRTCFGIKSQIYWLFLGLSVGLGLLTKYTMALFYLSAFLYLLLSKEERGLLLTKGPYIACIISLMLFSPVILWNAHHDWVTLKHTAGQVHISEGIRVSFKSFFDFLGSQLGVITPLLLVLMAVSVWSLRKERKGAFLFWFSMPVLIFFLLKSMHAKVQANWALPGYLTGIVAFSVLLVKKFYTEKNFIRILIVAAVVLSVMVTFIGHSSSLLDLPPKYDPTSRLRGWKELGKEVTKIYGKMSETMPTFIFSDSYQVSSELAFYVKSHPVTYCINLGRRMNQYDLWTGYNNFLHYDAIFVRIGDVALSDKVAHAFEKVEKRVFTVYTKNKSHKIRDYSIFLCYNFKGIPEEKPGSY